MPTPTKTITGPQLKSSASVMLAQATSTNKSNAAELPQYTHGTLTPTKIRSMRKDPTIALVRGLLVAPALLAPWSYEEKKGAPKGAVDFIEEQIAPLRTHIIRQAILGCVDFGWAPFEKIFKKEKTKIGLRKLKPLLQDWTDIIVHNETGAFYGFQQWTINAQQVYVPVPQCLLHSFDVEGTYWYGQSYMANVEDPYDSWANVGEASDRYDTKIAGSHWVIHYPIGTSKYEGQEDVDNEYIARQVLRSLQSSGMIAVPKSMENFIADLNNATPNAWEIDLITDSGATSASFTDRQGYYDKLKVRGFGFPERSILEGQFGTKAEAGVHADFAIAGILLRTDDLVRDLNWHLVNQLLRLNWGPDKENLVVIKSGMLGEQNRAFLKDLYTKLLDKPEGFTAEFDNIDRASLRDALDIPTDEEAEADELRDPDRLRDRVRSSEPEPVGGLGQRRESDEDSSEDSLGAIPSDDDGGQPVADGTIRDSVRDAGGDDSGLDGETDGDPPVRK